MRRSEWPLVGFTILTQLAVGAFVIWGLVEVSSQGFHYFSNNLTTQSILIICLVALFLGSLIAGLHLSRPIRSGFALSNIRSSWLSREALLGGLFGLQVFVILLKRLLSKGFGFVDYILIPLGIITGLLLVYIISRLYMLRTVPAWNNLSTPITFFITSVLLGLLANTVTWFLLAIKFEIRPAIVGICILVALQLFVQIITIFSLLSRGGKAAESVRLLWSDFRFLVVMRWITAFVGLGFLVSNWVLNINTVWIFISLILLFVSEILGRILFYGQYRREGY